MLRVPGGDLPAVALDDRAGVNLGDARRRPLARQLAAARLEHVEAAAVLDPRADVGTVDAVLAEELLGHARDGRRTIDAELGDPIGTLIPPLEHETAVVHAVVVVEMREERVGRSIERCPLSISR